MRMKRGNQALKPDPNGVKLIYWPMNIENTVRFSSGSGGARRVVKLNVSGILELARKTLKQKYVRRHRYEA